MILDKLTRKEVSVMETKYIVFDGMDGSGKGTQIELLKKKFGDSVVFTREPGGTPFAEGIRDVLLSHPHSGDATALASFLLFWAAREELQQHLVVPMLRTGMHVFSDRSDSSTFAFQLHGEEHLELIDAFLFMRRLVFESPGRRPPDLYVIFDLPAEVARGRVMQDTNRTTNHFDVRALEYYERVRNGFRKFATHAPVIFIGATQVPEKIHRDVLEVLTKKMSIT